MISWRDGLSWCCGKRASQELTGGAGLPTFPVTSSWLSITVILTKIGFRAPLRLSVPFCSNAMPASEKAALAPIHRSPLDAVAGPRHCDSNQSAIVLISPPSSSQPTSEACPRPNLCGAQQEPDYCRLTSLAMLTVCPQPCCKGQLQIEM